MPDRMIFHTPIQLFKADCWSPARRAIFGPECAICHPANVMMDGYRDPMDGGYGTGSVIWRTRTSRDLLVFGCTSRVTR